MLHVARNSVGTATGGEYIIAFHGRETGRMAPLLLRILEILPPLLKTVVYFGDDIYRTYLFVRGTINSRGI